jgi:hypothetical protein
MEKNNISVDDQLESIHAMLADGHKSIRLERHTLPLWGGGIGFLTAFSHDITNPVYQLNPIWGRVFQVGLLATVLLAVIWIDYRMTRAARALRDESISLIQRKVTLAVWMLFAFAFLLDVYANNYLGGGRQMFGVYLLLTGVALSMFGLYSERWYRWSGIVLVLLGLGVMFILQPGNTSRLLTASVFIVGGCSIAFLQPYASSMSRCMLLSFAWVLAAFMTTALAYQLDYYLDISADTNTVIQWSEFQQNKPAGKYIVRLSPGTEVPVDISVGGDVFEGKAKSRLVLTIAKQIDMEFRDGKATGVYRVNDGPWLERNDAMYTRKFVRETILTNVKGPELVRGIEIGTQRRLGGLLGD